MIKIRNERPEDYLITETMVRDAFWNHCVSGASEHYIVHKMRSHKDFIPELSYVIEESSLIVGAIYYSKSTIVDEFETKHDVLTFGPVAIAPKFQNRGYGAQLIRHSIEAAKEQGYPAIIILGAAEYYQKFGFVSSKQFQVAMADGNYYQSLLLLPLNYELTQFKGQVLFSDLFEVTMEEVEDFDQLFPKKVKEYQPSQDEFQTMSLLLDEKEYE